MYFGVFWRIPFSLSRYRTNICIHVLIFRVKATPLFWKQVTIKYPFCGTVTIAEDDRIVGTFAVTSNSLIPRAFNVDENTCALRTPVAFAGYATVYVI